MEVRILQKEEIDIASGLSRYVFDYCLRNRMEFPQTIAYVEDYIASASLKQLYEENRIVLWGAFDGAQMVAVSAMQSDGMITMLYVLPQCQNKGYGSRLLKIMREYAKNIWGFDKVILNANPAWTSGFFGKMGFVHANNSQNLHVPFVSMYAKSSDIAGFEKKTVSGKVIAFAIASSILFATIAGVVYMIWYLF